MNKCIEASMVFAMDAIAASAWGFCLEAFQRIKDSVSRIQLTYRTEVVR
ncbi:hypothetical protein T472_0207545 [Youngiibacter fragilis 232.1]|uniref:Uncharacterized protein n=1 Tax=Youngiibacter fragilis 232.1 TaxID=994573 RepID=V7I7B9_9CLOT|nr:hypothetical protein T472_0207545 [Youngiibacter fragilis 232.1]